MNANSCIDVSKQNRQIARAARKAVLEALEGRTLFSTFTVANTLDDGSVGSLRWAVTQANANAGADTINFNAATFATPKTITLGGTQLELTDTTGATTITGPVGGVTISAGGLSRVIEVDASVTASMSGLTITGGKVAGFGNAGGGLTNYGTVSMTNCTVSGNAAGFGSGINTGSYASPIGSTALVNCTVSGNAGFADVGAYFGTTTLTNSIVLNIFGTGSGSNNVLGNGVDGLGNGTNGNHVVGPGNLGLAPLGYYGGTGETMPPLPGSPAIDAGMTGAGIPTTDERGVSRFGAVDIGAFESQGFTFAIVPGSTPQSANIGTAFSKPLSVRVTANNAVEPVDGAVIKFVANPASNGANAIFAGASTGVVTGGVASVNVVPDDVLGSYTVTATNSGFSGSFALTNTGTVITSLVVNTTSDAYAPGAGLMSLREAVAFADLDNLPNSNISFDPTVFKTLQTIHLTNGQLEFNDTVGATSIAGPDVGVNVDAGGFSRVIQVDADVTASFSKVNMTGGNTGLNGGGLDNAGTVTLTHCTISGNQSTSGLAGGIYTSGPATLTDCTVSGNTGYEGGGVVGYGAIAMTHCTVRGNVSANYGGGGVNTAGPLTMTNCTVTNNTTYVQYSGGGGGVEVAGNSTLTNCTISGNSVTGSGSGGGVDNTFGTLTMINVKITGNSAPEGGGVSTVSGTTTMIQCTVSGNTAGSGGGVSTSGVLFFTVYAYSYTAAPVDGITAMTNCVVSGNSATSTGAGVGGGVLTDVNGDTILTTCTVTGNSAANNGGGVLSQGAAPGTNYGGYTNYSSTTMSGCIVSGNSAAGNGGGLANAPYSTTSVTGTAVITNTAMSGGGVFNQGTLNIGLTSISFNNANTSGGGISSTGGDMAIAASIIAGNNVTSKGTAVGGGIDAENSFVTISGCVIDNNSARGATALGGGLYLLNVTVTINASVVTGNNAVGTTRGQGGGIFSSGGSLALAGSIVTGNKASTAYDDIYIYTAPRTKLQNQNDKLQNQNNLLVQRQSLLYSPVDE